MAAKHISPYQPNLQTLQPNLSPVNSLDGPVTYTNNSVASFRIYDNGNDTAFVGPALPPEIKVNFSAHSLGIRTTCEDLTDSCNLTSLNSNAHVYDFHCPSRPYFTPEPVGKSRGSGLWTGVFLALFNTSSGTKLDFSSGSNPIEYGVVAVGSSVPTAGWIRFLWCRTFVIRLNYTMVNLSTRFRVATSNHTLMADGSAESWLANGIFVAISGQSIEFLEFLKIISRLPSNIFVNGTANESLEQFPSRFALELSHLVLSYALPNLACPDLPDSWHTLENITVARIPIAPRIVLTAISALYGGLAITVATIAWRLPREHRLGQPRDDVYVLSNLLREPGILVEYLLESGWNVEKDISMEGEAVAVIVVPWLGEQSPSQRALSKGTRVQDGGRGSHKRRE